MDREKIYQKFAGYPPGAYTAQNSPYHNYFEFFDQKKTAWPDNKSYDGWWGNSTLPKLYYENSEKLVEEIMGVAVKWVSEPKMKLQSMMTVTFTKLLVMRMVANVRSLSWRSISILRSLALCSTSKSAMSAGERLKKEISDALANPESSSKNTTKKMEITTPRVGV